MMLLDGADADLFQIVDRNADRLLNRTEFQQFRDGYCSRADPTRGSLFTFIDRDGDGVVSPGEFRRFFAAADIDGDGFISRGKFAHYEQVVAPITYPVAGSTRQPRDCPHLRALRGRTPEEWEVVDLIEGILEGFRSAAVESSAPLGHLGGASASATSGAGAGDAGAWAWPSSQNNGSGLDDPLRAGAGSGTPRNYVG